MIYKNEMESYKECCLCKFGWLRRQHVYQIVLAASYGNRLFLFIIFSLSLSLSLFLSFFLSRFILIVPGNQVFGLGSSSSSSPPSSCLSSSFLSYLPLLLLLLLLLFFFYLFAVAAAASSFPSSILVLPHRQQQQRQRLTSIFLPPLPSAKTVITGIVMAHRYGFLINSI